MSQLTIDGVEVPAGWRRRRDSPLHGRERAVLELLKRETIISSSQAGRAAHDYRNTRRRERGWVYAGCIGYRAAFEAEGCCKWAPSDGLDVLRRLAKRGMVEQIGGPGGLWVRLEPGQKPALPPFDPRAWKRSRR